MRAHKAAILARLREEPRLANIVFDSDPDAESAAARPVQYVVVYSDTGSYEAERLTFNQTVAEYEYEIQCVHATNEAALAVAEAVMGQLMNWRPLVEGRSCWPIRHVSSDEVQRDRALNQFYTDDVYVLRSTPK